MGFACQSSGQVTLEKTVAQASFLVPDKRERWRPTRLMFMPVTKRHCNAVFCNANGNLSNITIQDTVDMINLMPCNGTKSNGAMVGSEEGLGIASYLKGKQFFITGATGFLGKGDKFLIFVSCFPLFFNLKKRPCIQLKCFLFFFSSY